MKKTLLLLKKAGEAVRKFAATDRGKSLSRLAGKLFHACIIFILIWQIWAVGINEVISSIPVHPLFYIIFLILYTGLPLSEYFIYRRMAPIPFIESQWILHYKRIYNKFLIGYSGEVYLFTWLNNRFQTSKNEVFAFIRDNNSLSVIASWIVVSGISGWLLLTDETGLVTMIQQEIRLFLLVFLAGIALYVTLAAVFKRKLYSLSLHDTSAIFSIHILRTALLAILQVYQWYIIIPDAGLQLLFNFLALQMVIGKIPFIPNKELIYISLSLYLAQATQIPLEEFTSLLVVHLLLEKGISLLTLLWKKKSL